MTEPIVYPERFPDDASPIDGHCPHCGCELYWIDCHECGGEGFFDMYEEDPLWYDEDDTEECSLCHGRGGWTWCPNVNCPGKNKEVA